MVKSLILVTLYFVCVMECFLLKNAIGHVDPLVSEYGQTISYQPHIHANTIRSSPEQHRCPHNL